MARKARRTRRTIAERVTCNVCKGSWGSWLGRGALSGKSKTTRQSKSSKEQPRCQVTSKERAPKKKKRERNRGKGTVYKYFVEISGELAVRPCAPPAWTRQGGIREGRRGGKKEERRKNGKNEGGGDEALGQKAQNRNCGRSSTYVYCVKRGKEHPKATVFPTTPPETTF